MLSRFARIGNRGRTVLDSVWCGDPNEYLPAAWTPTIALSLSLLCWALQFAGVGVGYRAAGWVAQASLFDVCDLIRRKDQPNLSGSRLFRVIQAVRWLVVRPQTSQPFAMRDLGAPWQNADRGG